MQLLWQQSAASDCNQERHQTLANCCSLSSAVSSALCCQSRSLLLRSLSCCSASAQVLVVLLMMHTTARADHKELSAKKALCKSRLTTTLRDCASPSRRVNETTCTHHCNVLMKQYAHHCIQNCSGQANKRVPGEGTDYRHCYRDFSHAMHLVGLAQARHNYTSLHPEETSQHINPCSYEYSNICATFIRNSSFIVSYLVIL